MENKLNVIITKEAGRIEIIGYKGMPVPYDYDFKIAFYETDCQYSMPRKDYNTGHVYLVQETVRYGLFESHRDLLELLQAELDVLYPGEREYFDYLFRQEISTPLCVMVNGRNLHKSTIKYYSVEGAAIDDIGDEGAFVANFTPTGVWLEFPRYDYISDDSDKVAINHWEEPATYFYKYEFWNEECESIFQWLCTCIMYGTPFKLEKLVGQDGTQYGSVEELAQKIASTIVPIHWGE